MDAQVTVGAEDVQVVRVSVQRERPDRSGMNTGIGPG
jgi:hypothetical protein